MKKITLLIAILTSIMLVGCGDKVDTTTISTEPTATETVQTVPTPTMTVETIPETTKASEDTSLEDEVKETVTDELPDTLTACDKVMYVIKDCYSREFPNNTAKKENKLTVGSEVTVTAQDNETKWYVVDGYFVDNTFLSETKPKEDTASTGNKDNKDTVENKDNKDTVENKDNKDAKDTKDTKDTKDNKDTVKDNKDNKDKVDNTTTTTPSTRL